MTQDTLPFAQQVLQGLLGDSMTSATYTVAYMFAFFGMFLRWYWQYQKKGKPDPNTPHTFVLSYWLQDNLLPKLFGMLATFVILFISLRFPQEVLGKAFSYFYAFTVGISLDYVSGLLKKMTKAV